MRSDHSQEWLRPNEISTDVRDAAEQLASCGVTLPPRCWETTGKMNGRLGGRRIMVDLAERTWSCPDVWPGRYSIDLFLADDAEWRFALLLAGATVKDDTGLDDVHRLIWFHHPTWAWTPHPLQLLADHETRAMEGEPRVRFQTPPDINTATPIEVVGLCEWCDRFAVGISQLGALPCPTTIAKMATASTDVTDQDEQLEHSTDVPFEPNVASVHKEPPAVHKVSPAVHIGPPDWKPKPVEVRELVSVSTVQESLF